MGCKSSAGVATSVKEAKPDWFKNLSAEGQNHYIECKREKEAGNITDGKFKDSRNPLDYSNRRERVTRWQVHWRTEGWKRIWGGRIAGERIQSRRLLER